MRPDLGHFILLLFSCRTTININEAEAGELVEGALTRSERR
jgi:hypothetical protein